MLALSTQSLGYSSAFARAGPIKAVAEGVAPDFTDKPWTSSEIKDAAGLKELAIKLCVPTRARATPSPPRRRAKKLAHRAART